MAKRKKKALSQKVVNVATSGMPSPVRKFASNRLIALLIVLTLPVLYATGVVSIEWHNGRPSLSFDRQRAAEIKANATEKIHTLRGQQEQGQGLLGIVSDREGATQPMGSVTRQQNEGVGPRVAERVEDARGYIIGGRPPGVSVPPTTNGYVAPSSPGVQPAPRIKQLFDRR